MRSSSSSGSTKISTKYGILSSHFSSSGYGSLSSTTPLYSVFIPTPILSKNTHNPSSGSSSATSLPVRLFFACRINSSISRGEAAQIFSSGSLLPSPKSRINKIVFLVPPNWSRLASSGSSALTFLYASSTIFLARGSKVVGLKNPLLARKYVQTSTPHKVAILSSASGGTMRTQFEPSIGVNCGRSECI